VAPMGMVIPPIDAYFSLVHLQTNNPNRRKY
jgi:hypothetical protein